MNETNSADEIPEEFHSFSTGAPFATCIECECSLHDKEYFIEKAIKTYPGFKAADVIFELAICVDCAESLRQAMSAESQLAVAQFMQRRADASRQYYIINEYPHSPEKWTEHCLISGKSRSQVTEYQLYAHCHGDQLINDLMPYMISGEILDEITGLLSNQTLGEMDDFMGRHFGPPSLAKELPSHRTLLV